MGQIRVDVEKCNKDGICVQECPLGAIEMDPETNMPVAAGDFDDCCLACGHCVAVCPKAAFHLDWLGPEACLPAQKELDVSPGQAEQFLRARRSIRNYRDRPVAREKIEKLLEIAGYAPSAKNNQPWRWTVVETPGDVRHYAGMVIDWMRTVIEMDPDMDRMRSFLRVVAAWDSGIERICRGAPCVIVVHGDKNYGFGPEDCALALSYLELYAPVLGLGGCWGGYFYSALNNYPPLSGALGIPADHKTFGAMMLGYPKFKYHRLPMRNVPQVFWK
jgi:nitroreductase/NAD-dependent dihydropyrimidine dehydrogenase PreA subunit